MANIKHARTLTHTENKVLSRIYFLLVMKESKFKLMVMKALEDVYR